MTWTPANISATCQQYPLLATCQPPVLAFIAFLAQNFGYSYDKNFSDKNNENINGREYDFIIVGGGAAGCVLANRLSEVSDWKVLLLEAGDEEPIVADIPAFYTILQGSSIDWNYQTQPEPYACNDIKSKACPYNRGKVLGGSTSINGMMYVRGNRKNYDYWASLGNHGWSYEDVLPYFLKSENNKLHPDSDFHSTGGYLTVDRYPFQNKNSSIITDAWKELGFAEVDYNGYTQIGVSETQSANINGARLSMNGAFIRPIRGRRPNLTIKTNTLVTKVIIDKTTKRAIGVEYSDTGKRLNLKKVYAKKEVILSAGSIDSPKILMLSGIGHADVLKKSQIEVIKNLPVGDNFQDHVILPTTIGIWNNRNSTNVSYSEMINDVVYWQSTHNGPLSDLSMTSATIIFDHVLEKKNLDIPNIQIVHVFIKFETIKATESGNGIASFIPSAYNDALIFESILVNPKSRGTIRLNETDPIWSPPIIKPNYLTHRLDREILVESCLKNKNVFNTQSFKKNKIKKYTKPFKLCKNLQFESRKYYECVVKKYGRPGLHAIGTCKMGPQNDRSAVVSPRLQVHGIDGLRVIDASIMPSVTSGNTFAPTVMIAEKGSDLIKEDWLGK